MILDAGPEPHLLDELKSEPTLTWVRFGLMVLCVYSLASLGCLYLAWQ
jgi:hypothetical protein